jgi:hypothetical protein
MTDNPSLIARMYNGLDERKGWPIVITKPIVPVSHHPLIPVGEITPRKPKRKSWWRRLVKALVG